MSSFNKSGFEMWANTFYSAGRRSLRRRRQVRGCCQSVDFVGLRDQVPSWQDWKRKPACRRHSRGKSVGPQVLWLNSTPDVLTCTEPLISSPSPSRSASPSASATTTTISTNRSGARNPAPPSPPSQALPARLAPLLHPAVPLHLRQVAPRAVLAPSHAW